MWLKIYCRLLQIVGVQLYKDCWVYCVYAQIRSELSQSQWVILLITLQSVLIFSYFEDQGIKFLT